MFVLSEDQALFKDVVARFFTDKSPPDVVRNLMTTESGFDPDVWQVMSSEVGIPGLHIPEAYGGFGFGMVELGLVLEAMGRHLYCGPYFASSIMAGFALLQSGNEAVKSSLLPDLASGAKLASLALDDVSNYANWGNSLSVANGVLNGKADIVLDAGVADHLLVIARSGSGLGLFVVQEYQQGVGGVTINQLEVIDPTRKLYSLTFEQVQVQQVGEISDLDKESLWDIWCLCLSHEMLGGAQYLLESTVDYTKLRYQFGRPVGSFQGLKHRCAELLMELELARGVLADATQATFLPTGEKFLPSMAKACMGDAYLAIAKAAVQLRGGIGFTWENDTHLWFKRAKSSEVFLGSPAAHRERIIQVMEETGYAA